MPSIEKYHLAIESYGWVRVQVLVGVFVSFGLRTVSTRLGVIFGYGGGDGGGGPMSWLEFCQRAEFMNMSTFVGGWRILSAYLLLSLLIGLRFIGYFSIGESIALLFNNALCLWFICLGLAAC